MANETAEPREEFHLPITLTVGEKQIEVPLVVTVSFPELAAIVREHLEHGTDVYGALLERYAESVGGKTRPPRTRGAASNGGEGASKPRRKKVPEG